MNTATAKKRWVLCVSVTLLMAILGGLAGCLSAPQTSQGDLTPIVSGSATSPEMGGGSSVATQTMPDPIATSGSEQGTAFPLTETIDPNRQAYEEYATQVAAGGGMTLVPYDTAVSVETAYQLELTSYAESLFTPTPFGPLPFPGTRLTDEELAERGWPRIGAGGVRNEDYHTTAIWLDKEYVDAEIFSKYQALFDLLAFRDGPPGEDFAARLAELMVPDVSEESILNATLQENFRDRALASCTMSAVEDGVNTLRQAGAYVRVLKAPFDFQIVWEYVEDQPAPLGTYTDKAIAFQVGDYYAVLLRTGLQDPARTRTMNGLTFDLEKVALANSRVMQRWVAPYQVTHSNETVMAIWLSEINDWRILKYDSPYCGDFFPKSLEP